MFEDGKLSGDMLAFYINGNSYACEISCDFSFSVDMKSISPYMAGGWQQVIPGIRSWQMTVSSNFISHFRNADFKTVLKAMIEQTPMQIAMRTSPDYEAAFFIGGEAYASSGGLTSSGNDIVSTSTVFTGNGPLAYTSEASEGDFWRIIQANPAVDDKPIYYQTTI